MHSEVSQEPHMEGRLSQAHTPSRHRQRTQPPPAILEVPWQLGKNRDSGKCFLHGCFPLHPGALLLQESSGFFKRLSFLRLIQFPSGHVLRHQWGRGWSAESGSGGRRGGRVGGSQSPPGLGGYMDVSTALTLLACGSQDWELGADLSNWCQDSWVLRR